jgi:hypothetical protein
MGRDHLVINDFDNEFLNKYERNIKSRKKNYEYVSSKTVK